MSSINFLNENSFLILEKLLEKKCYLRMLAEETDLSPGLVHKITKKLIEKKIILDEKQKNRKLFSLNYESALTRQSLSMIFVNKLLESRAFSKLKKIKPRGIYLYGTAANGRLTENSDLDLAIFLDKKIDSLKLNGIKRELSNELEKEVQLIILTPDKLETMKKEKTELLNQIKNKSLILHGERIE